MNFFNKKKMEFKNIFQGLRAEEELDVKYLKSYTYSLGEHDPSEGGGCIDLRHLAIEYPIIEDDVTDEFSIITNVLDPIEFIP